MLLIINKVASTAVALVKKLLADLDDTKLSCETPIPKAPPSDFCKRITIINRTAKMILNVKIKLRILQYEI